MKCWMNLQNMHAKGLRSQYGKLKNPSTHYVIKSYSWLIRLSCQVFLVKIYNFHFLGKYCFIRKIQRILKEICN